MPLDQMLEDAITHPAANNTTVLARDYFYTIRPPTSARFRARLNTVIYGDGDLVEVQRLNAADGLEVVTAVCAGIHGGYWYLRNLHLGLGDEFLAGDARYPTLAAALEGAIIWWLADTENRSIVMRKSDFKAAEYLEKNRDKIIEI